jgi:hypothetical protein
MWKKADEERDLYYVKNICYRHIFHAFMLFDDALSTAELM